MMMKVKVIRSFVDIRGSFQEGDIIELPESVDWLNAGFVEPVKAEPKLAVDSRKKETAVSRRKK
jgi:hypothetical protein